MQTHREIPELTADERARFMRFIDASGSCHVWTGSSDPHGRGRFALRRYPTLAPRVAYRIANDRDPGALSVLHRCDNPRCVNPAHLTLGTQSDNLKDAASKGRTARGSKNGQCRKAGKLNEHNVREIKRAIMAGAKTSSLAAQYGVGQSQISNIKSNSKWSWVDAA